jgi:hypothetical protein
VRGTNRPHHGPSTSVSWAWPVSTETPRRGVSIQLRWSGSEPTAPLIDAIIAVSTLILALSPGLGRGFSLIARARPRFRPERVPSKK